MNTSKTSIFGIATVLLGVSAAVQANAITDPSPVVSQPPIAQSAQQNIFPLAVQFFDGGCDGGVISRNSPRCN